MNNCFMIDINRPISFGIQSEVDTLKGTSALRLSTLQTIVKKIDLSRENILMFGNIRRRARRARLGS
jgi:hypothetical protein